MTLQLLKNKIMATKIAISHFKSHCLEIIDKLQNNQQSIIITKRKKPVARVVPFDSPKASILGLLKDKAEIKGNILEPIDEKWEAEHE